MTPPGRLRRPATIARIRIPGPELPTAPLRSRVWQIPEEGRPPSFQIRCRRSQSSAYLDRRHAEAFPLDVCRERVVPAEAARYCLVIRRRTIRKERGERTLLFREVSGPEDARRPLVH